MNSQAANASDPMMAKISSILPDPEALYTNIHAHPELSMQETRTAGVATDRLRADGFEVSTGTGSTSSGCWCSRLRPGMLAASPETC